jgi:hypothetical protein
MLRDLLGLLLASRLATLASLSRLSLELGRSMPPGTGPCLDPEGPWGRKEGIDPQGTV